MRDKEIISILKSGEFSIFYHDNQHCTIHKGRISYSKANEMNSIVELPYGANDGYLPREVYLLVKALGGKCDSI